jgi:hypothetical protein
MKDIPKHILVTVIIMVVVGLLGGGAWFYTSQQLTQKLEEKTGLEGELQTVEKKGLFPSAQNKKVLEEQKAKLEELLQSLKPELQSRMDLFSSVRKIDSATGSFKGLDPDAWKKVFGDKRQVLRDFAKEKKLNIPEEYNFAFKSYVLAAPRAEHTADLGVELLAIEEITKIAGNAGVNTLIGIKRSMVEDSHSGSGGAASGGDEGLAARILQGPEDIYRIIPFEATIKGDPDTIIAFLNGLGSSKFLFVNRFVYLENEKSSVPKRSEVTAPSASGTDTKKTLIVVAGQEKVTARVRVDLIDFLPEAPEAKNPKAKK